MFHQLRVKMLKFSENDRFLFFFKLNGPKTFEKQQLCEIFVANWLESIT